MLPAQQQSYGPGAVDSRQPVLLRGQRHRGGRHGEDKWQRDGAAVIQPVEERLCAFV